ncbi:Spy/CpxP family protein refolding chaperone, partial [Rhodoferax sp. UBA5149]|uniref:Spy/CpxP family protein refolding chaperone n=1 Tax=Rhodoferax sp. UBA5149 TaxID=1947379 RepID=UPI0025F44308
MKSVIKPLLLAGLLGTAGFSAFSQAPAAGEPGKMMGQVGAMHEGMGHERMGKRDPARMQAWMDKRNAELKAKLKLAPAQEATWTSYVAAHKLPTDLMGKRPDRAEMDKLSTPERIDRMRALRTQHVADMAAAMDKRGEATKAFYATLTPEQQ